MRTTLALFVIMFAVVHTANAATYYFDGFENAWSSPAVDPNAPFITSGYPTWQKYDSELNRVVSGTNGITAKSGNYYGLITPPATSGDDSGVFSRLGGYSSIFGSGFVASLDVYLDLSDPGVAANTYGFDASVAASNQSGNHLRDFIFHAAASNDGSSILIGGSNNSNSAPRHDLASINHYEIDTTGWYTMQWDFHDAGDGSLAVDLNLLDASGNWLWTETRNNAADDIATIVGGNRYMWLTFVDSGALAIDNAQLVPEPGTLALLGIGAMGVGLVGFVRRRKVRA